MVELADENIFSLENNNFIDNNMIKKILRNFNRLKTKVNKIPNSHHKDIGNQILKLYETRQISQFRKPELIFDGLIKIMLNHYTKLIYSNMILKA